MRDSIVIFLKTPFNNHFTIICIFEDDVAVAIDSEGSPKLLNKNFVKNPAVLHGNGPSKLILNNFGNYIGGAFENGVCKRCQENTIPEDQHYDFTVLIALFIEVPSPFLEEFFDKILALNYPEDKIHLLVQSSVEFHSSIVDLFIKHAKDRNYISVNQLNSIHAEKEYMRRELAVKEYSKKKCDYLFMIDSEAHIDNLNTLKDLISQNRSFIAPMMTRVDSVWSNFWGAISDRGFYARSSDYLNIVKYEVQGIW